MDIYTHNIMFYFSVICIFQIYNIHDVACQLGQYSRVYLPRTTPQRVSVSLDQNCNYLTIYCMRAYLTGEICGRSMYFRYRNFRNYCDLDYINCVSQYEVWKMVHVGYCENYEHHRLKEKSYVPLIVLPVSLCGTDLIDLLKSLTGWDDETGRRNNRPRPAFVPLTPFPIVGVNTTSNMSMATTRRIRTVPTVVEFSEECHYLAYYCIKGHKTGKICAQTIYRRNYTFDSYCMLDFANCMERYELWHPMYMGECLRGYWHLDFYHYNMIFVTNETIYKANSKYGRKTTLSIKFFDQDGRRNFRSQSKQTVKHRSTKLYHSFDDDCYYMMYYCFRSYKTGRICGRTLYYRYYNFENYCKMDYVNCMERYQVWQIVHMGDCYKFIKPEQPIDYVYRINEDHLEANYVLEKEVMEDQKSQSVENETTSSTQPPTPGG